MRIIVLVLACLALSCSTSKSGKDFTVNRSRSTGTTPHASKHGSAKYRRASKVAVSGGRMGIVSSAEQLLGAKYRYGGDTPSRGFDCSGFTCYVLRQHGRDLPRTSDQQANSGRRKRINEAQPGDLIFFGTASRVTHVGIVTTHTRSHLEVIHSTSSKGVRKDDVYASDYWRSRLLWAVDASSL